MFTFANFQQLFCVGLSLLIILREQDTQLPTELGAFARCPLSELEALRLRWGPVSAWGITASPTVEHWFAWLEEAENLALASFPAAEKLARLPTPAADAEEFVSKQDVFAAELDVSLLCEVAKLPPGSNFPKIPEA
ncbi:hypothetical protein AK812_SmicGene34780 [Symbiodinium microadriaticum]|uniref:Uncharacterized protein n=1 Tax=Symbiodinium microadriaticum TaxID=2951 RepID=A0A1Q9CN60_SYMMI|nr:hypothetical protein AK812_SmicGene34780 [Symbiodinium microadriaticum]